MQRPIALPFVTSLLLAGACLSAGAQTAPTELAAPDLAASAPAKPLPAPRLLSPGETREKTSPPPELRTERPVTPQISIPVGRTAAGTPLDGPRPLRPVKPALSGSVDDAAARCNAEVDDQARAKCRDALPLRDMERAPG